MSSCDLKVGRRKEQGRRCWKTRESITSSMCRDNRVSNRDRLTTHTWTDRGRGKQQGA